MPVILIEVPPDQVDTDEVRFPDRDDSWIFEHLLHYCSLLETLPAIGVVIEGRRAVVTRGHKYLQVARLLGRARIRAVIQSSSDETVEEFRRRPDVRSLNWAEIDAAERTDVTVNRWHVFYFDRSLTSAEKARFDDDIAGFFERLEPQAQNADQSALGEPVRHDDLERRAEFVARTPAQDESWYAPYLATARRFDADVAPIVSYQGRKFSR